MEIKIRYTFKRKSDGKIWQEVVPIECLEGKGDKPFVLKYNSGMEMSEPEWEVIGRDLWTGEVDKNGDEVFHGDIMKVKHRTVGKGNKTGYKDFYIPVEFYNGEFHLPFRNYGKYRLRDGSFDSFEKVGCIYTTPELVK